MAGLLRRKGEQKKRRRKKSIFETPFIVRVFERHLKTWKQGGGLTYATPKKAAFQHMVFRSRRFGLMETKWMITALCESVTPEKMDEVSRNAYRTLKGMECVVESKGFPRRQFEFKPSKFLTDLKVHVPELNISDELAKSLNRNEELMQAVKKLRPDDLEISLHSIPTEYQPFLSSREMVAKAMAEYFSKPVSISWSVSLTRVLSQGIGATKTADEIVHVLNEITTLLKRKTDEMTPSQTPAPSTPTGEGEGEPAPTRRRRRKPTVQSE